MHIKVLVACKIKMTLALDIVGLQPTVIASRAPHLLLEQSVKIQRIVDVHRPSNWTQSYSDQSPLRVIQLVVPSFASPKGASKMLRATGHARMVIRARRARPPEVPEKAPLQRHLCKGTSAAARAACVSTWLGEDTNYHARMARRAQHLRCSLRRERSERADNRLDKDTKR